MTTFQWALPAGLAVGGIGAAAAVAMVLGNRRRAAEQNATAEERAQLALQRRNAWQRRLAVIALGVGCLMMFVLAGIAAWLSFGRSASTPTRTTAVTGTRRPGSRCFWTPAPSASPSSASSRP